MGPSFNFGALSFSSFIESASRFIFQLLDLCCQVKVETSLQQKTSLLSRFEGFVLLYDSFLAGLRLW